MKTIINECFDEERAFYGCDGITLKNCRFEGEADGESALKECRNITVDGCVWRLRYPFWHDHGLHITDTELTPLCRAALWYSDDVTVENSRLHGIKALRECARVTMKHCDVISPEFGWSVSGIRMSECRVESEYFMMRSERLHFDGVTLQGKYSFQYIRDAEFDGCMFDTKDAFWHAKNVVVKNSVIKGEYLAWYCENVTFDHCKIAGTQPLCYCKGLRLIDCEMTDTDLCFERSEVEATLTSPVLSIKNPLSGSCIRVPKVGEIIRDIAGADGTVLVG